MKRKSKLFPLILGISYLFSFNSCSLLTDTDPTKDIETTIPTAKTGIADIIETQEAFPETTPTYSTTIRGTPSLQPGENIIMTPKPEQQVYTDPEGWYSITFPSYLEPTEKESYFSKEFSFIETGYLPEMGMMSNVRNVCAWLVNVVEKEPENFIYDWTNTFADCAFLTKPDVHRQVKIEIYENPSADPDHRFAYVKTGWSSPNKIPGCSFRANFSWLKPINDDKFIAELPPLDQEIIDEWENIAPILQDVSVTEYDLPSGSHALQDDSLSQYVPEDALPNWGSITEEETDQENMTLSSLGYELETEMIEISSGPYARTKLYRDGRLLFDYVFHISHIYNFSTDSGHLTAFTVTTKSTSHKFNAYLIQNDAIIEWTYSHQDPPFPPILFLNQLLWLKVGDDLSQIQVIKSNSEINEVLFSFLANTEPVNSTNSFTLWDGHWIWAMRDFLIQDGELLNEAYSFQEIFNWRLIDNKPAYLFRKDGRVGFSYDGKIIPLEYQNVARYWWSNQPHIGDNSAHFFAEREGIWYYVVIKFR